MSDGAFGKVKRLVRGGVADAIEAAEARNPLVVMREAVREAERASERLRAAAGRVASRRILAARQEADARAKAEELGSKAKTAFSTGRPDLAEALISRQIDLEAHLPKLAAIQAEAREAEEALQASLSEVIGRKEDMERDIAALQSQGPSSRQAAVGEDPVAAAQRQVAQSVNAFERAKRTMGATLEAADADVARKVAEFDALERRREIDTRLARLGG